MRWTQRYADLWNNLGFSLCVALSICYVIVISNGRKRYEIEQVLIGVSLLNTRNQVQ